MCTLLTISSAGYYEWVERKPSARSAANDKLVREIVEIHKASRKTYGSHRIRAALSEKGKCVNRKRILRLMRSAGIQGVMRRRFRCTTDSNHKKPVAPNLLNRTFTIPTINTHWCGDITYISTREGWLYLAVVIDLASRSVVGWSMGNRIDSGLVTDALSSAILRRRPPLSLMFHSDRGSQYVSDEFLEALRNNGVVQSMSRKGNCWDNSVSESFFGTLKSELGDPVWVTRDAARAAIFEYIEVWYNRQRLHSSNGYLSPERYEQKLAQLT
jgi:transposase InsO family protein